MRGVMAFLSRPLTPTSAFQTSPAKPRVASLRDDLAPRNINHVFCTGCRRKMLPSLDRTYYCMGCKCATSNQSSCAGVRFIDNMLFASKAHELFGEVTEALARVNSHA
jgi:hypothetical protein